MLDPNKHCELLTEHIRDQNQRIGDGFKLFVQMVSAITGGVVWLRVEHPDDILPAYAYVADALMLLVVLVCAVIICDNLRAWHSYRKRLSIVAGDDGHGRPLIPPPQLWASAWVEFVMLAVMVAAIIAFWIFNPLSLHDQKSNASIDWRGRARTPINFVRSAPDQSLEL